MNQSSISSSVMRLSLRRHAPLVAVLGAVVLVPGVVAAKERKAAPPTNADIEARSKELMKKHFPMEEDIGPLPVVRVPKAEEVKPPPAPPVKAVRIRGRHGKFVRASAPPLPREPMVAAEPTPPPADEAPAEKPPAPPPPAPKKEAAPPREGHEQASALGSEESRQIDNLLSHALTDSVPAPEAAEDAPAGANLPPLGMAAIKETMQALQPEVKRNCRLGRLGVVQVRVEVSPSGDVQNVTPEGKLAATPPASCVVERVKRAHFPRSGGGNFQYTLTVR